MGHSEALSVAIMVVRRRVTTLGKTAASQKEPTGVGAFFRLPLHQRRIAAGAVVYLVLFIILHIGEQAIDQLTLTLWRLSHPPGVDGRLVERRGRDGLGMGSATTHPGTDIHAVQ